MYENLLKAVTNLGSPNVLLAGDFMLDVYVYGEAERISPEAPVPVLKVVKTDASCGGAGGVAVNLAALRAQPVCVGVIGKDANGDKVRDELLQIGADVAGLLTAADGRPTVTKTRLIGRAPHRHQQQLFRMDEESTEPLAGRQCEQILQIYTDKLSRADIVCLQDYNKGLMTAALCRPMLQAARSAGKKVIIDPSPAADYSIYAGATVITPNRREASLAVGSEIKTVEQAGAAAAELLEKLKLEAVVITLDREGAYLRTEEIDELLPTKPRDVYDVTGAGDTVLATLAVALAAGCDYRTAVRLANITGGIEVEKFGGATATIEEIINELIALKPGADGKIRPADALVVELDRHRKQNRSIVWTNGCFDVIHTGHVEFLKFCRRQGDIVVVGLNSDKSVRAIKGPDRPIHNQFDRMTVLAALETVDYVTIFDEPDPLNIIKKVRPDIIVKGKDWATKKVVGQQFVESYGGKLVLAPLVKGKSTTSLIEKIKSLATGLRKTKSPTGE